MQNCIRGISYLTVICVGTVKQFILMVVKIKINRKGFNKNITLIGRETQGLIHKSFFVRHLTKIYRIFEFHV